MGKKDIHQLTKYWQSTAEHDYLTMLGLYKIKRYSDSLFYGHIVLEKILKAHVVRTTKKEAPKIHNLVQLAALAKLNLSRDNIKQLRVVDRFNMRSRYPDIKLQFYKSCTRKYTTEQINIIKNLYLYLCQNLKQKK